MIEADRVELRSGEPATIVTPSLSGKGQKISRCPKCHIAVWSNYAGAGDRFRFVRVGTLDMPDALPPDVHIFTMSRQPWVVLPPDVPAVEEFYDRDKIWSAASLARWRAVSLARGRRTVRRRLTWRRTPYFFSSSSLRYFSTSRVTSCCSTSGVCSLASGATVERP